MKKFSILAAAAAIAFAAAAPVAADEAKTNADPFVSSQGGLGEVGIGALIFGTIAVAVAVAAIDSSDDT